MGPISDKSIPEYNADFKLRKSATKKVSPNGLFFGWPFR